MSEPSPKAAPPAGSLWRNEAFLKLWGGQTVSLLGSQVTLVALPLAAILLFHATPFQVGVLGAFEFLPFLLFGLPAGVWIDRVRKRPILIWADMGRFVVIGSIPLADGFGVLTIAQLYVVAFVSGVLTVLFDVAYISYLPSMMRREQLVEGNAKLEVSRSGAQIAGPGVAGELVGTFGAPVAMLTDAVSYVASVVALLLITTREAPVERRAQPEPMRRLIAEGLRYVGAHRLLRPLAVCTATMNFFGMIGQAVILLFAVGELGLSPRTIGLVLMVGSVGFLIGAFLARRLAAVLGLGSALVVASLAIGVGWSLAPLASTGRAVPFLVAYGLIASFGGAIYNVNARSLVQSIAPERMLGRVVATTRFVVWGTIPLGSFVGGVLGGRLGLRPTLWIAAGGSLSAFLAPLLSALRRVRSVPAEPDVVAGMATLDPRGA